MNRVKTYKSKTIWTISFAFCNPTTSQTYSEMSFFQSLYIYRYSENLSLHSTKPYRQSNAIFSQLTKFVVLPFCEKYKLQMVINTFVWH
jgi:hypothetical protein